MKRNNKVMDGLLKLGDEIEPKLAWNAATPAEHEAWRKKFKAKLRQLLGKTPQPVPLEVHWAEKTETDAYTRHKIYIRTEEHFWLPAYYFVPKKPRAAKNPAIISLHGHGGTDQYLRRGDAELRKRADSEELDFTLRFAEAGYTAIFPFQRGWGETVTGDPDDTTSNCCYTMSMNALLTGMTPVGQRVWDAMRVLDFLETQDDVDAGRVGAAGLSGGGTVGLFFSAMEPRIKLAMIAGYFCTFRGSIFAMYHCICNCIPHIMEWGEMSDVAALIAPRPILVISGKKDDIFPVAATRKAFAKLAQTYDKLDAADCLKNDYFDGPHAWSHRKVPAFLERHL